MTRTAVIVDAVRSPQWVRGVPPETASPVGGPVASVHPADLLGQVFTP